MAYQRFTVESLATLDSGRVKEAIEQALRRAELDCKDRPGAESARVVSLQIHLTPQISVTGELESVDVTFDVTEKHPSRKSRVYEMAATRGGLMFNDLSPDDVRQGTIDDAPKPKGVKSNAG